MGNYCMYLRKSRADLEAEARGEGETLTRHMNILQELAKRQKLPITRIYKEIVSGDSISARPQMQMLLSDLSQNIYDGVLVVEIERLARGDTIDQGIVAQAFKQSSTKIITPVKTYDPDNEFDEEYFEFSLFMSRREYKTIKRRLQAGRLEAIKEGNYIGTNAPYGYRKISPEPKVHTLEIIPEEAEIIKLIYQMYLDGHGAKYISSELNRMGIKPKKAEFWENPSIKKILSNPIYCGMLSWKTKANGETLYPGLHQPIIPKDTFDDAQLKKQHNPAAQIHRNDTLQNYYHGLLYCKNCGHQMKRRIISSTGKEHALCVYRQCRSITVSSSFSDIDDALLSSIRYRIEQLKNNLADTQKNNNIPIPDKKAPIVLELEKSKKKLSKLYDLLETEIYDVNTFLDRSKPVKEKIIQLEKALSEMSEEKQIPKLSPEDAIVRLQYVLDHFNKANATERNKMLKSAINKILYSKSQKMCCNKRESDLLLEIDFL